MADLKTLMEDIARAIRLKTGVSDKINAQDFPQKIREIGDNSNTSASLNIAYGETAPEDTSKLWIKANKPNNIKIGSDIAYTYIESSGTQWIDTGYIPKANTKIVLRYTRNGTQSDESIFGTSWSLNGFFLMHYRGNLRWHGKTASVDIPESGLADFREVSVYGTNITVNGTSYTVTGNGNDTQSDTLRIFGVRGNTSNQPIGKLKLYELKIYEYNSNTDSFDLVRNYKPKQSKEIGHENEACLYDDVTETYLYNQGSGEFGGEIITPELTQGNIEIKTSLTKNKFNLINTNNTQVKIGVDSVLIGNENNEAENCEAYLYQNDTWVQI